MNKKLFDRFMSGKVVVHVSTQEECSEFMKFLEDNTDKIWSTGEKPTEFNDWYIYGTDTVIYGDCILVGNRLTFGNIKNTKFYGYSVIEFEDLMKEKKSIKFKVGDKVRVRSWESMKKEFGLDGDGDISTSKNYFLYSMKKFCETVHTIKSVNNELKYYFLEDGAYYKFSEDMLETVKEPTNGEHFRKELKELKGIPVAVENGKPERCVGSSPTVGAWIEYNLILLRILSKMQGKPIVMNLPNSSTIVDRASEDIIVMNDNALCPICWGTMHGQNRTASKAVYETDGM